MDNQQIQSKTRQTVLISVISILFTIVTIIFLAIAVISLGVTYNILINTDNTACALKSGYGLFVVAVFIEIFMLIFESIVLCMMDVRRNCCRCERFHTRFIMHFVAAAMIMVGAIIYGSGDRDKVQWSFWMAFCAAILAMINGIIWSITLKLDRYFNKGGSAVKTQGWGLTKQSDGLGGGSVGTVFTGNLGGGAIDGNLNGSGGGSLGDNLGSNDFGNLAGLEGGILDDNLGKKDLGVDIGENIGGNIGSKGPDALGGDFGSGPLGGDLGNDGLGGDKQSEIFGDGIKNVSVDINTSNLGSVGSDNALGVGLESRTLESISLGSSDALALDPDLNGTDPIIIDELKSAPIDPILQAELTTVPKDITNVTHKPLESGQASSVTDSPLSQLPLTVGSNIDLIKGVDTAGLDISEPHDNLGI